MANLKNYLSLALAVVLLVGAVPKVSANNNGMDGQVAPEITLPDQNGLNQSLSALRGGMAYVVFWRSGDPNSRINNASLHLLYGKYKNLAFQNAPRGFEIYSISTDGNKTEWMEAMDKDQLPGIAVRDVYGHYLDDYKVDYMPASYLVDGNGNIIGSNMNYANLDQTLANLVTGQREQAIEYAADMPDAAPRGEPVVDYLTYKEMQKSSAPAIEFVSETATASSAPQPEIAQPMATFAMPASAATATASPAPSVTSYKIQLGAFQHPQLEQFAGLASLGSIYTENTSVGISRVLLGDFATTETAVRTLSKLQHSGYVDAFIVIYKGNERQRVMSKAEVMQTATALNINIVETPIVAAQPVHVPDLGGHASVAIPASSGEAGSAMATHSTITGTGLAGFVVTPGSQDAAYQPVSDVQPAGYVTTTATATTTTYGDDVIAFHGGNSAPYITTDATKSRGHAVSTGGTTYYDQQASLYPTHTRTGADLATGTYSSAGSATTTATQASGSTYYTTGGQPYTPSQARTKERGAATTSTSYYGTSSGKTATTSVPYTSGAPRIKSIASTSGQSQLQNMSDTGTSTTVQPVQVLPEDCICPTEAEKRAKLEKEELERKNGMLSKAVDEALGKYTSVTTGEVISKSIPANSGRLASKDKRETRKERRKKRRNKED